MTQHPCRLVSIPPFVTTAIDNAGLVRPPTVAYIDELMIPIVEELWRHGLPTVFSCQGNGRDGYIDLLHPYHLDAEKKLRELALAAKVSDRRWLRVRGIRVHHQTVRVSRLHIPHVHIAAMADSLLVAETP